jgi:uncharacterized protein YdaU (DUF1376 family)
VRSYPHHIGDFNHATRHLTRIERSVYRDMIELYYDTEKPLPLDVAQICRLILARSNEESTAVESSLNEFFTKTPNGWYHVRCEAELEKFNNNNSQRAQAGKASAAKKALKKLQALNGNSTTVEIPLSDGSTGKQNLKPEPKPNNESTDVDSKPSKFIPPTVVQVAEYCQARGNTVNPQTFVDHYTGNGWMRGKTKIKDWQACVRTWETNQNAKHHHPVGQNRSDRNTQAHRDYVAELERQAEAEAGGCLADPAEPSLSH